MFCFFLKGMKVNLIFRYKKSFCKNQENGVSNINEENKY